MSGAWSGSRTSVSGFWKFWICIFMTRKLARKPGQAQMRHFNHNGTLEDAPEFQRYCRSPGDTLTPLIRFSSAGFGSVSPDLWPWRLTNARWLIWMNIYVLSRPDWTFCSTSRRVKSWDCSSHTHKHRLREQSGLSSSPECRPPEHFKAFLFVKMGLFVFHRSFISSSFDPVTQPLRQDGVLQD